MAFASKAWSAALLLSVGISSSFAQHKEHKAAAGGMKVPELKYEEFKLPNGLTVLTHEDHRLPLVAVDLWYHVGPLNERPRPHRLRPPFRTHDV